MIHYANCSKNSHSSRLFESVAKSCMQSQPKNNPSQPQPPSGSDGSDSGLRSSMSQVVSWKISKEFLPFSFTTKFDSDLRLITKILALINEPSRDDFKSKITEEWGKKSNFWKWQKKFEENDCGSNEVSTNWSISWLIDQLVYQLWMRKKQRNWPQK